MNMYRLSIFLTILTSFYSCSDNEKKAIVEAKQPVIESKILNKTSVVILGTVQDAGSPQIGCLKKCCTSLNKESKNNRMVCSMGIIDPISKKKYLIDATPDVVEQLHYLNSLSSSKNLLDGMFLTHAHIGHYTGLMYLGKEAINSKDTPVYCMPRMIGFLKKNGPWSQLVSNKNIVLEPLSNRDTIHLNKKLKVIPFLVPHRDEYSETVGYKIIGPHRSALFIPDIDKWDKWRSKIKHEISQVDYAFIDGTFYDGKEINHRNMAEIPHPFIIETMEQLKGMSKKEKNKVYFIHLNHTNPALNSDSNAFKTIINNGFHIASINEDFSL